MATIHEVEIFRPGTHNRVTFDEARIDRMIIHSNACLPYIMESIATGTYPGNNINTLGKPIPGLINFAHQRFLPETLREAVKDTQIEFKRRGAWVVATIKNVKQEIVDFIRERLPFRSVELINELMVNGQKYYDVIRSIAFLPPDIPPAVGGQSPYLAVEYAADAGGIITMYSYIEEDPIMTEDTKQPSSAVSIEEFAALKAEMQARAEKDEREKNELRERLGIETSKREIQEVEIFCAHLANDLHASPAVIAQVKPLLLASDNQTVKEFMAGQQSTAREGVKNLVEFLFKNQAALTVPIGEFAAQAHTIPDKQESSDNVTQRRVMEFWEVAKSEAKNPNDKNEIFLIATSMASKRYGDALTGKGGK